ncbi:MAG TPA: N-acetylneuraminate synthase family protein [Bacteroidales bacterium]|nr:N-acetylneuraminate synthase family protein [Bacteroidales bacterium]
MDYLEISGRRVGLGYEPFVILEVGINHNGDIEIAKRMVDQAHACGADAVKFQTFKAEEFIADPNKTYTYKSQGHEVTESMLSMFKRFEFTPIQWKEITDYCNKIGILFFSTPQNPSDLDFLLEIVKLPVIKVGSDDLTNVDLLKYYASKKIPLIISAGMAYLGEIEDAVNIIRSTGNNNFGILHCVSSYPAKPEQLHLKKMATIAKAFEVPVGFSDHTEGIEASIAAIALGACILEKHFTLDKNLPGPDHWFSSDPVEVEKWVRVIRSTFKSLGSGIVSPTDLELEMRSIARRSIVAKSDLPAGTILCLENMTFKRPGTGLPPKLRYLLEGRRIGKSIRCNDLITLDILENDNEKG